MHCTVVQVRATPSTLKSGGSRRHLRRSREADRTKITKRLHTRSPKKRRKGSENIATSHGRHTLLVLTVLQYLVFCHEIVNYVKTHNDD